MKFSGKVWNDHGADGQVTSPMNTTTTTTAHNLTDNHYDSDDNAHGQSHLTDDHYSSNDNAINAYNNNNSEVTNNVTTMIFATNTPKNDKSPQRRR